MSLKNKLKQQGSVDKLNNLAMQLQAQQHDPSFNASVLNNSTLARFAVSNESIAEQDIGSVQNSLDMAEQTVKSLMAQSGVSVEEFNLQAGVDVLALSGAENLKAINQTKENSIRVALENAGVSTPANAAYSIDPGVEYALESFDEKNMRKFLEYSVVLNVLASRQDAVNKMFYRALNVAPDECGYAVEVRIEEVYQGYDHSMSGDPVNQNKRNLIDALVFPEVLESNATQIVPSVSPETDKNSRMYNKNHYVDETKFPARTVFIDEVEVKTSYLNVNQEHDLLGLTAIPEFINSGLLNEKDTLDTRAALKSVALLVNDKPMVISLRNLPRTAFLKTPEGDMNQMQLMFTTDSIGLDGTQKAVDGTDIDPVKALETAKVRVNLKFNIYGNLNRQTGSCNVTPTEVTFGQAFKDGELVSHNDTTVKPLLEALKGKIKVVGYEIDVNRSNTSLRTRGRLIDSTLYREIIAVPLRAPISIEKPVVGGTKAEPQLSALVNAVRIQSNNDGIATLFSYADALNLVTSRKGYNYYHDRGAIPGLGRHFVLPVYIRESVDLVKIVNSPASESKLKDIQGALTTKLNEVIGRALQQSNYIAVADQMGCNPKDIKVVVGTDYRIPQFLNIQGDVRLFGDMLPFEVASTPNQLMRGKIVMSVTCAQTGEAAPSPFEFGNFLWSSELMVNKEMQRGNQTFSRDMIQPRYTHTVNVPIIIIIDVEGIEEIAGNIVTLPVSLSPTATDDAQPAPKAGEVAGGAGAQPNAKPTTGGSAGGKQN